MPAPAHFLRLGGSLAAGAALLALTGCSSGAPAQALETAQAACSAPAPSLPAGFDVRSASPDQLSALASSATARKTLAEQAASADDRWQALSDAASAISSFAGVLRDARMAGRTVDDSATPQMWDQYKYASDAFVLECRGALAQKE